MRKAVADFFERDAQSTGAKAAPLYQLGMKLGEEQEKQPGVSGVTPSPITTYNQTSSSTKYEFIAGESSQQKSPEIPSLEVRASLLNVSLKL